MGGPENTHWGVVSRGPSPSPSDLSAFAGISSFILKLRINAGICRMAIATAVSSGAREEPGEVPKDEGRNSKRARGSEHQTEDSSLKGIYIHRPLHRYCLSGR